MPAKSKPRPPRNYRRYSDAFRAAALAALDANGGNVKRTARELGIPYRTLAEWVAGRNPVSAEDRAQKRVELADAVEHACDALTHGIVAAVKAGKASVQEMAVALGISVEKLLLLRNQPTSIHRDEKAATIDLSRLSVADLEALLAIQRKAEGRPPELHSGDPDNPDAVVVTDADEG